MPDVHLEPALLTVASGAVMALVPASAAERYLAPGVRFVALADPQPAVATAVVTRCDTTHLPIAAFLRAVARADRAARTPAIRATVSHGRVTGVRCQDSRRHFPFVADPEPSRGALLRPAADPEQKYGGVRTG